MARERDESVDLEIETSDPAAPPRRIRRAVLAMGIAFWFGGMVGVRLSELRCAKYRCTSPTIPGVLYDALRDDWTELIHGR